MRRIPLVRAALLSLVSLAACAPPSTPFIFAPRGGEATLQPFRSEAEFEAVNDEVRRQLERLRRIAEQGPPPPPPPPPSPVTESVTSTQTAGVDEGGIVKVHGDHLVVLRRGRLFTVRIGGDALQPVAAVDAFGPGIDPERTWYDELLVSGDHVVVVGFSYERGGSELGIFRIGADGSLAHRSTFHLRSGDYYSTRNYASRLIGSRLIFYAPIPVEVDLLSSLPAMRRWGGADSAWIPTVSTRRIYRPATALRANEEPVLHSVTSCELGGDDLACESTALLGPPGREFYVSAGSVYLWAAPYESWEERQNGPPSVLYRMPLDGSAPTGVRVEGEPIDQFSFLESADGHLNVLTLSHSYGGEGTSAVALLRVPLAALTDGSRAAGPDAYRALPGLPHNHRKQNRFVGDWLLYGVGIGWGTPQPGGSEAYAVRWAGGGQAVTLSLPHRVDRIEAVSPGAVLVGGDGEALHFSSVRLDALSARLADRYTRPGASQGETRSHGFFYRPDGEDTGVLGLPIRGAARPGYEHLFYGSAAILFLRNQSLRLREIGELAADTAVDVEDACRASCVDWYGNARPLFLRGRVFALMGYELVEGALDDGRVRERRRVSFAPRIAPQNVAGEWSFTESLGYRTSLYFCRNEGTLRLEQDGREVTLRYRQTGECAIDGATTRSDGEGTGSGRVNGHIVTF
ncbi:MAG TPA: beta-propeller domain-containing protein, partial [Longimicrobium sp.]|nr:beta-propeller domain-containing protein [Longimicrobium sp.]